MRKTHNCQVFLSGVFELRGNKIHVERLKSGTCRTRCRLAQPVPKH